MNASLNSYIPQPVETPTQAETSTAAMAAQAQALIQARYMVAISRPRDLDVVRQKLLKECQRPGFADAAIYHKPIGDGVEGPSIRFAEAALRCMTNIVVETTTLYDDDQKRIVQVSVTDLEANVPYSQSVTIRKAVERRKVKKGDVVLKQRTNSYGDPVYLIEATDDEILNTQNALISKAIRTLGLRLVPGDIVDECMALAQKVCNTRDAQDPDTAKRKLFDAFAGQGVTADQLKDWLGHKGDVLNPKELSDLRGLYAALKDGETTWREIMDAKNPAPSEDEKKETATKPTPTRRGVGALKSALQAEGAAPAPASDAAPERRATEGGGDSDAGAGEEAMPL